MLYPKVSSGVLAAMFVAIVVAGVGSRAAAQMQTPQSSTSQFNESTQTKIAVRFLRRRQRSPRLRP